MILCLGVDSPLLPPFIFCLLSVPLSAALESKAAHSNTTNLPAVHGVTA